MADIASRSRFATGGTLCDIHHIADMFYTRSEKTIASPGTLRRLPHHMDHRLDLRCHPL